jgi:hypothetical protein
MCRCLVNRPPRLPIDKLSATPTHFIDTHYNAYSSSNMGACQSTRGSGRAADMLSSESPIMSNRSGANNSAGRDVWRTLTPLSDRRGGNNQLGTSASTPSLHQLPTSTTPLGSGRSQAVSARRQAEARLQEIEYVKSLQ